MTSGVQIECPGQGDILLEPARARYAAGCWEDAASAARAALSAGADASESLALAGLSLSMLGRWEEALEAARRSEEERSNPTALAVQSNALLQMGDAATALSVTEGALSMSGVGLTTLLMTRAAAAASLGEWRTAGEALKQVSRTDPSAKGVMQTRFQYWRAEHRIAYVGAYGVCVVASVILPLVGLTALGTVPVLVVLLLTGLAAWSSWKTARVGAIVLVVAGAVVLGYYVAQALRLANG